MAELNILGVPFAEEYGGAGADNVSYVIALEELARVCASTAIIVSGHTSLATWPIFELGLRRRRKSTPASWPRAPCWARSR